MTNSYLALALGFAFCLGGCATASQHQTVAGDAYAQSDDAAFKLLDMNGDGYLTVDELEQQHAVALLRDMHRADTNADRRVSLAEWHAWWPTSERAPPAASMELLNRSSAPLGGGRSAGN
ncbi:MAG: EF-hand domain-containing protein [Dokdonella sp.]